MPNLKNWIEAQLKRGYSRKQIKNALISKGYSPKAVAEDDKIGAIKTSQKINNQKPSYSVVLLILAVALLIVIAILIYNNYQRVKEQGTATGETAQQEISEKGLENAKETEAMENNGEPKKSENNFCVVLLPENVRNITVEEYNLNYHIDGSKGNIVKWIASEQPLETFSPFDSPKIFSVYDNNTFEGCGYLEKLENKEKNSLFKNEAKSQLRLCNGKEIYLKPTNGDNYNEPSLGYFKSEVYYFKSEEEIIHVTIFSVLPFNDEATILSNLGCEI